MIRNVATLEVKIDGKSYQLLCECDSPLGSVHDALSQMKLHVIKMINDAAEKEPKSCKKDSDCCDQQLECEEA
jgi:hypothetical protein